MNQTQRRTTKKKTLITSLAAAVAVVLCGTARAAVPSGYKQLEYIESDGNQRIKTGSASMLPAESAIVGLPVGWRLLPAKEGIGYDIKKDGFSIYIR